MKSRVLTLPFIAFIVFISAVETYVAFKLGWPPVSVLLMSVPTGVVMGMYAHHCNMTEDASSRGDE